MGAGLPCYEGHLSGTGPVASSDPPTDSRLVGTRGSRSCGCGVDSCGNHCKGCHSHSPKHLKADASAGEKQHGRGSHGTSHTSSANGVSLFQDERERDSTRDAVWAFAWLYGRTCMKTLLQSFQ